MNSSAAEVAESRSGLRPADALVALGLFAVGLALRLPLAPWGETVEETLDPIVSALALRDHLRVQAPPFLHFGYGRGLSWFPLVVGAPDGLLGVAMRRVAVQALVAPVAFLAARRFVGRVPGACLGPGILALLLATSEEFLHTGVSGHETYMSAEWGALALLAAGGLDRSPRGAAAALGACLAMAVMNHPMAAPTLLLLLLPASGVPRRIGVGVLSVLLLPQAWRVGSVLLGHTVTNAPLAGDDRLGVVLAVLQTGRSLEVGVLLAGLPLAAWVLRKGPHARLAWIGCGVLGLALLDVAISGSSQAWYWRPQAPLLCVVGGLGLASVLGERRLPALVAAAAGCVVVLGSVDRAAVVFEGNEPGLRHAGYVTALGNRLESRRAEGPRRVRAVSGSDGWGRHQLAALAVDRLVAGDAEGLFDPSRGEQRGPVWLHVEAAPLRLPGLRRVAEAAGETLASGDAYILVELPDVETLDSTVQRLCALEGGDLRFDDPVRWGGLLGQVVEREREPICSGAE